MVRRWFSAKTLYRTTTRGRAQRIDGVYVAGNTLIEERIVLIKARSPNEALRRAEAEARAYSKQYAGPNLYGQKVVTRYLENVEVFEMFDPPGSMVEVYSSMYTIGREVADRTVVRNHFGPAGQPVHARVQFQDGEFFKLRHPRKE